MGKIIAALDSWEGNCAKPKLWFVCNCPKRGSFASRQRWDKSLQGILNLMCSVLLIGICNPQPFIRGYSLSP
jgi:hypothetical protein